MAKLCPFRQFVDADGLPLALGKVHTYITTTATPKTTYADISEGTSLPNPIILSSAGTKNIYLDTAEAYTFVITDALDNPIDTIDDVIPITTAVATQAQMETGTSTATSVAPGRMLYHLGMPKAQASFTTASSGTAACTLSHNYGITSIARNSAGIYVVTFSTAFSSTTYGCMGSVDGAVDNTINRDFSVASPTVSVCYINIGSTEGTNHDGFVQFFGDQA